MAVQSAPHIHMSMQDSNDRESLSSHAICNEIIEHRKETIGLILNISPQMTYTRKLGK